LCWIIPHNSTLPLVWMWWFPLVWLWWWLWWLLWFATVLGFILWFDTAPSVVVFVSVVLLLLLFVVFLRSAVMELLSVRHTFRKGVRLGCEWGTGRMTPNHIFQLMSVFT
jgi:hypothetical protein